MVWLGAPTHRYTYHVVFGWGKKQINKTERKRIVFGKIVGI